MVVVTEDLKNAKSHFRFGENWKDFSSSIDASSIDAAIASFQLLLPSELIANRDMLDIGSGSGLSAVAALRLGARQVTAVDIDADSVKTTRAVLAKFAPGSSVRVEQMSAFDLDTAGIGHFDVVHSWGVLHHTGDVRAAIVAASRHVCPDGLFVVSLYRRTDLDWFWVVEKRLYAHGPVWLQPIFRNLFKAVYLLGILATGRNPIRYVRHYGIERGMSWSHDVHDWLGGYPYEPMDKCEVTEIMTNLGFTLDMDIERPVAARGFFGSPCNEYRFRRADGNHTAVTELVE